MKKALLPILLAVGILSACKSNEFIIGADISWVPQEEANGKTYSHNGTAKDVLEILKDNGFNWIRLRLFVDPAAPDGYSVNGFCGLDSTIEFARRIKAAGMKFLLDFHYSDNWADPSKQFKPSEWKNDTGKELEDKIYRYTQQVMSRFMAEGIIPDMVQTGNEINHGMVWPDGSLDNGYDTLSALLRSAGKAVRETSPKTKIMIHIACGGQNGESVEFFDNIMDRGVDFDVIGQSYYPEWHGTLDDLQSNLTDLAERYRKPLVVVEYRDCRREVNDIVAALPHRLGMGTFIWEATSPQWGNLFDKDGATNENMSLYPEISRLNIFTYICSKLRLN